MKNEIKKLRDEFNKKLDDLLKQEVKFCNPLIPGTGQEYWYTNGGENCYSSIKNKNDMFFERTLAMGNIFLTEQACEDKIAKRKAIQMIKMYIIEYFPFEPDWNNDKIKWHIVYKNNDKRYDYMCSWRAQYQTQIGFLKSEEDCEEIISKFKNELNIIFNVK